MSGRQRVSGLHFMLTSIRHWDVITCEIKFEIWNPSNKQKKVQVGKDQEKAQSAKDSHSKNPRWEKNQTKNQVPIP